MKHDVLQKFSVRIGLDERDYWVGGSDGVEGVWKWVNGKVVPSGTPYWAVYGLSPNQYAQVDESNIIQSSIVLIILSFLGTNGCGY